MTTLFNDPRPRPCDGGLVRRCGEPGTYRVNDRPLCKRHIDDGLVLALARAMELGLRKRGRMI